MEDEKTTPIILTTYDCKCGKRVNHVVQYHSVLENVKPLVNIFIFTAFRANVLDS